MAFDCFLKIETIPGESTDDKHKDWIEVLSFSTGISQGSAGSRSTAGARSSGRADFADFTVVHSLDKASPKLALACAKGEHIKTVTMTLNRAAGNKEQYMEYKLEDVLVSSVNSSGSMQSADTPAPGRNQLQLRQDDLDVYRNRQEDRCRQGQGLSRMESD